MVIRENETIPIQTSAAWTRNQKGARVAAKHGADIALSPVQLLVHVREREVGQVGLRQRVGLEERKARRRGASAAEQQHWASRLPRMCIRLPSDLWLRGRKTW